MKTNIKRTVAATLAAGMLILGLVSCDTSNINIKDNASNNSSNDMIEAGAPLGGYETEELYNFYNSVEESLKADANIEFDKLVYYCFTAERPETLILIVANKAAEEGAQPTYRSVLYDVDLFDVLPLFNKPTYKQQAYPFTDTQLDVFREIIENYDPCEVGDNLLTEDFQPKIDEIVNEYCK